MELEGWRSPTTATDRSCPKTPNSCMKKLAGGELGRDAKRRRRVSFAADSDIQQVRVFEPPALSSSDELLSSVREDQDTTHQQATPKSLLNDENAENQGKLGEAAAGSPGQMPGALALAAGSGAAARPLLSPVAGRPRLPLSTLSPVADGLTDTTIITASMCLDPKMLSYDPAGTVEDSINFGNLARHEDYYQDAPEPEPELQHRASLPSRRSSILPNDLGTEVTDMGWSSAGTTELRPLKRFLAGGLADDLDTDNEDDSALLAEIRAANTLVHTTSAGNQHTASSIRRESPTAGAGLDTQALLASSTQELDASRFSPMQQFNQLQQYNRQQHLNHHAAEDFSAPDAGYHTNQLDTVRLLEDNTVRLLDDNTEHVPLMRHMPAAAQLHLNGVEPQPEEDAVGDDAGLEGQEAEDEPAEEHPRVPAGLAMDDTDEMDTEQMRALEEEVAGQETTETQDGEDPEALPAPSLQEVYEFLRDECNYTRPVYVNRGKSIAPPSMGIEDYQDALQLRYLEAPLAEAYSTLWPSASQLVEDLRVDNQELEARVLKSTSFRRFWSMPAEERREQLLAVLEWARAETKQLVEDRQRKEYAVLCGVLRKMDAELTARVQMKCRNAALTEPCTPAEALALVRKEKERQMELRQELERHIARLEAENAQAEAELQQVREEMAEDEAEMLAKEDATLQALRQLQAEGQEQGQEDVDEQAAMVRQQVLDLQNWQAAWMRPPSLGEGKAFWHGPHRLVECVVYEDPDSDQVHACGLLHPENGPRHHDGTDPLPHVNSLLKDLLHVWADCLEPLAVCAPAEHFWPAVQPLRRTLRAMDLFLRDFIRGYTHLPGLKDASIDRATRTMLLLFLFPSLSNPPATAPPQDHTVQLVIPVEALVDPAVLQTKKPYLIKYRKWYTVPEQDVLGAFWEAVRAGPLRLPSICAHMEACFVRAGVCHKRQ